MARSKIFDDNEPEAHLDLSEFSPKKDKDNNAVSSETMRIIAETADFKSREAVYRPNTGTTSNNDKVIDNTSSLINPKKSARVYRTGRNVQFNVKASQETINMFYDIANKQGWVLGETLEKALIALKKDLSAQ